MSRWRVFHPMSQHRRCSSTPLLETTASSPQVGSRRLPYAFGLCFTLLAASQSLPMTAMVQLIYQQLGLPTEVASEYFLAIFLPSFFSPVFGFVTDRGGQRGRRWSVVVALLLKSCSMGAFALGTVTSLPRLYAAGLVTALGHSLALSALDGALCSHREGASGDTTVARAQQATKLACQTLGDLTAALLSLVLAGFQAPLPLVYALTSAVNALGALTALHLPLTTPPPKPTPTAPDALDVPPASMPPCCSPSDSDVCSTSHAISTTTEGAPSSTCLRGTQQSSAAPRRASQPSSSTRTHIRRSALGPLMAALAAVVYMLPPTPGVAIGSYVGRANATAPWVLSARQLSSMAGGFAGIGLVSRLDLPLAKSLPVGACATAASQLCGLLVYALGGNSSTGRLDATTWHVLLLLLESAASNALGLCGVVPVLALCAAAAEGRGVEGGAYGLVAAADAAGALAAGSLSTLAVHALHIGNSSAEGSSWDRLPLFIVGCACCKVAAVPGVLLLLRLRRRALEAPRSDLRSVAVRADAVVVEPST